MTYLKGSCEKIEDIWKRGPSKEDAASSAKSEDDELIELLETSSPWSSSSLPSSSLEKEEKDPSSSSSSSMITWLLSGTKQESILANNQSLNHALMPKRRYNIDQGEGEEEEEEEDKNAMLEDFVGMKRYIKQYNALEEERWWG